jgi:hypothetical protein
MTDIAERLARAGYVLTGRDSQTGESVKLTSKDGWFTYRPAARIATLETPHD